MILENGNKVLCVEDNSIIRSLTIESVNKKSVSFSQTLNKDVTKKFSLKKGTFKILPIQYLSEHETQSYKNPEVKIQDKVQILHVKHPDSHNKNRIGEIGIVRRIVSGDMEKSIAVDFG